MVAKLIRHELRATARMMGFLYLAAVVITGAEMIGFYAGQPVVGVIFMLISYLHMMVLGVMTIVIVVRRFHSNLFGDQGYLTMCLPVKPSSLVFSKLLVALIWMILDVVFSLFSIFFMVSSAAGIEGLSVWQTMNQTFQEMGYPTLDVWLRLSPILAFSELIALLFFISLIYFSIAVANTGRFHRHNVLAGFLIFCGCYLAGFLADLAGTFLVPLGLRAGEDGIFIILQGASLESLGSGVIQFGIFPFLFDIFLTAALLWGTCVVIRRHLSLK